MNAEQIVVRPVMDRVASQSVGPSPLPLLLPLVRTVVRWCEEVALCRGWLDSILPRAQPVSIKETRRHRNSPSWIQYSHTDALDCP